MSTELLENAQKLRKFGWRDHDIANAIGVNLHQLGRLGLPLTKAVPRNSLKKLDSITADTSVPGGIKRKPGMNANVEAAMREFGNYETLEDPRILPGERDRSCTDVPVNWPGSIDHNVKVNRNQSASQVWQGSNGKRAPLPSNALGPAMPTVMTGKSIYADQTTLSKGVAFFRILGKTDQEIAEALKLPLEKIRRAAPQSMELKKSLSSSTLGPVRNLLVSLLPKLKASKSLRESKILVERYVAVEQPAIQSGVIKALAVTGHHDSIPERMVYLLG